MCTGSVLADETEDAAPGIDYRIATTSFCGPGDRTLFNGVVHRLGKGLRAGMVQCAVCIREPRAVQLSEIPRRLQREFGLGKTATVLFLPGEPVQKRWHSQDQLELASGVKLSLHLFAGKNIKLSLVAVTPKTDRPSSDGQQAEPAPELAPA